MSYNKIKTNYGRNFLYLHRLYSFFIKKKRLEIYKIFKKETKPNKTIKLLDVGTTSSLESHENILLNKFNWKSNIYCLSNLNLKKLKQKYPLAKFYQGDGRQMFFKNNQFNIVFSSENNGDTARITIPAEPHDTEQSWPDEFTAEKNLNMVVGIDGIFDRLITEVTNPRASTLIEMVVAILLMFAGIQSRMNRRKWAAHLALLEAMKEAEDDGLDEDSEEESETPIVEEEEEEEMVYDDDDIELV